jgi:transposase
LSLPAPGKALIRSHEALTSNLQGQVQGKPGRYPAIKPEDFYGRNVPMCVYVGIDVGSTEHAVYMLEEEKEDPATETTISNDSEGFKKLEKFLFESGVGKEVRVGLEATGNYWKPVFNYLRELEGEFDTVLTLINPNKIHQFKKLDLTRVKTDTVDAKAVARYLLRFKPKPTPRTNKRLRSLRKLCRFRLSRVDEKIELINQLNDILVGVFPEYEDCFSSTDCVSLLAVLKKYPGPNKISEADEEELATLHYGKSNHRLGEEKAEKLIDLASNTVGEPYGTELEVTIRHLADRLLGAKREVEELDERIEESYNDLSPNKLTTIDGIGEVNAAIITAEIWDVNRFSTATKLNGYVGAYPELSQSGKSKNPHPEMTNKGNPRLRRAIFTSTLSAVTCNPVIEKHYQRQLAKGKDRMVAIGSCMRKLVHIIYGILTSDEEFDPNYEEKRDDKSQNEKGRTQKPQTGCYPADERSSEFSHIGNIEKLTEESQLTGGDP